MNSNSFMRVQVRVQKKNFFEFKFQFEFGKMIEFEFAAVVHNAKVLPIGNVTEIYYTHKPEKSCEYDKFFSLSFVIRSAKLFQTKFAKIVTACCYSDRALQSVQADRTSKILCQICHDILAFTFFRVAFNFYLQKTTG